MKTPSPRLLILSGLGLLLAWMAGKDLLASVFRAPPKGDLAPTTAEGARPYWYAPETPPPGAWEAGWGMDILLLLPAERGAMTSEPFPSLVAELARVAPVYAPAWTIAQEGDAQAALDAYLGHDNRGRGVLFVALAEASAALPGLALRVAEQPDLAIRVAGYVALQAPGEPEPGDLAEGACSRGLEEPCAVNLTYQPHLPLSRFVTPNPPQRALPREDGLWPEGTDKALRARLEALSEWLEVNGPKPAPPLPPLEVIEDVPVYSVGGEVLDGEEPPAGATGTPD